MARCGDRRVPRPPLPCPGARGAVVPDGWFVLGSRYFVLAHGEGALDGLAGMAALQPTRIGGRWARTGGRGERQRDALRPGMAFPEYPEVYAQSTVGAAEHMGGRYREGGCGEWRNPRPHG